MNKLIFLHKGLKFDAQGDGGRFAKDVVRVGSWVHPATGQEIVFDAARIRHLAETTNQYLSQGNKIPFPAGHSTNPMDNLGCWPGPFIAHGDALVGVVEPKDAGALTKIREGVTDAVSVCIEFGIKDSKGNEYDEVITHVCATDYPVVTGQDGFLELSRDVDAEDDVFVPLELDNPNHDPSTGEFTSGGGGGGGGGGAAVGGGRTSHSGWEEKLRNHEPKTEEQRAFKRTAMDRFRKAHEAFQKAGFKTEDLANGMTLLKMRQHVANTMSKEDAGKANVHITSGFDNFQKAMRAYEKAIGMPSKFVPGLRHLSRDAEDTDQQETTPGEGEPHLRRSEMDLTKLALALGLAKETTPEKVLEETMKRLEAAPKAGDEKLSALRQLLDVQLKAHGLKLDGEKLVKEEVKKADETPAEKELREKLESHQVELNSMKLAAAKDQAEKFVAEGKVPPAARERLSRLLAIAGKAQALSLSADAKQAETVALDVAHELKELLGALPSITKDRLTQLTTLTDEDKKSAEQLDRKCDELAAKAQGRKLEAAAK